MVLVDSKEGEVFAPVVLLLNSEENEVLGTIVVTLESGMLTGPGAVWTLVYCEGSN
jgi:hypothetical protein